MNVLASSPVVQLRNDLPGAKALVGVRFGGIVTLVYVLGGKSYPAIRQHFSDLRGEVRVSVTVFELNPFDPDVVTSG